jgi:hypothetical protein
MERKLEIFIFTQGKVPPSPSHPVKTEQEAEWFTELVQTFWRKKPFLSPARNSSTIPWSFKPIESPDYVA